jgi:hypothetical protein
MAASAAVIVDPALQSDIDPSDSAQNITIEPGASASALEALGVSVIQDFSTEFTIDTDVISFTNSDFVDIQLNLRSGFNNNNLSLSAPSSSAVRAALGANQNSSPYLIDFGSYDSATETFDTADGSVRAAGFGLTGFRSGAADPVANPAVATVVFFGADDVTVLDTQTVSNPDDGFGFNPYFAFDAETNTIGAISITLSNQLNNAGFDDLAFTVVPEPTAVASVGLLGLLGLRRRR